MDNSNQNKGFCGFLRSFLCPAFKLFSFIGIITIIDVIIYFITISFGIQRTPNKLLAPLTETLDNFGMKVFTNL